MEAMSHVRSDHMAKDWQKFRFMPQTKRPGEADEDSSIICNEEEPLSPSQAQHASGSNNRRQSSSSSPVSSPTRPLNPNFGDEIEKTSTIGRSSKAEEKEKEEEVEGSKEDSTMGGSVTGRCSSIGSGVKFSFT